MSAGLDLVDGRRDVYEKTLKLMIKEIERYDKVLNDLLAAGDMRGFCIEVHGVKGSLANIGAVELAAMARELESASDKADADFCALNLPPLLEGLGDLSLNLKEAFSVISPHDGTIEISSEVASIFDRLMDAFDEMDIMAVDEEIQRLNEQNPSSALGEEIENIKDAVLMTDYEAATKIIRKLTGEET